MFSCAVVPDSLRPHALQPTRLPCPWNSPGKNTGVCCHALLQGIFPTQGLNPGLLNCGQILYQLSHQGSQTSPLFLGWRRTSQGEVLFTGPTQTPSEQVQNSWNLRNQIRISWAFCDSPDRGWKQNSLTRKITRFIPEFSMATCSARSSLYKDLRESVI